MDVYFPCRSASVCGWSWWWVIRSGHINSWARVRWRHQPGAAPRRIPDIITRCASNEMLNFIKTDNKIFPDHFLPCSSPPWRRAARRRPGKWRHLRQATLESSTLVLTGRISKWEKKNDFEAILDQTTYVQFCTWHFQNSYVRCKFFVTT